MTGSIARRFLPLVATLVGVFVFPPLIAQEPTFEVTSIKRRTDGSNAMSIRTTPDGLIAVNVPISSVIGSAYLSQDGEYTGLPDWARTERYDIMVKAPPGLRSREQTTAMWRAFFSERLQLKAHDEMRETPIYNLVLARGDGRLGPQIKPLARDCDAEAAAARAANAPPTPLPATDAEFLESCGLRMSSGRLIGSLTMERLADQLRYSSGRVVRDRTGLTGRYSVTLTYSQSTQPDSAAAAAPDPNEPPSIFTALQEQLGLKLEPDRMPVQTVVIDHIARPNEN